MNFTTICQQDDKNYTVTFNDNFYAHFTKYYRGSSCYNILYRIFGLLPQDFYHYIGAKYNASYKPSPIIRTYIYMLFKKKSDAIAYANEIDKRLTFVLKKEGFI